MKPSLVGHICILKLYGPKWHLKLSLGSQICNLGVYGPKWHSRTSLRNGHVFYSFYKYDKRNRLHIRDSQPLHLEIIEIISGTDFFFLVILISVRNHCVHTLLSYVFLFLGTILLYYSTSFCVTIGTLHDPVPEIYVWSQVCPIACFHVGTGKCHVICPHGYFRPSASTSLVVHTWQLLSVRS